MPLGCLWICTVGIGSLAEATGNQKEAEAESLPQLPCHFLPVATRGPRQGLHLADPKSGLEALGECQDSVRISEHIAIGCHWMSLAALVHDEVLFRYLAR